MWKALQTEPILNKRMLIEEIASGEKPESSFGIGTEHEKFIFDSERLCRLPYSESGRSGIYELLDMLRSRTGWEPVCEGDNLIGLKGRDGDSITLEPGGQFELSGGILRDIHGTCQEVTGHLRQVHEACESLGAFALGMGFDPLSRRDSISWMPKSRYRIMSSYMPKVGTMGLDMMLRTCTVQVNLDFSDERDMVEKMRIAIALQPIATALFANSPFVEGRVSDYLSYRSLAWFHTDSARCGMLPFVFEEGFGYERWVDYMLDVPMYFFKREGRYLDASGLSFRDFLEGRLAGYEGEYPMIADWRDHMTTAFPEVRLKSFIEMRGADGGSWGNLCALPAFWVGLLYDSEARSAVSALVSDWSLEDMAYLRERVPVMALRTDFRGAPLLRVAAEVLSLAELGLRNRGCEDSFGSDESGYLRPLRHIVDSGETMAEYHVRQLHEEFGGDLGALMRANAY